MGKSNLKSSSIYDFHFQTLRDWINPADHRLPSPTSPQFGFLISKSNICIEILFPIMLRLSPFTDTSTSKMMNKTFTMTK